MAEVGDRGQTAAESERIRALIMNIQALLRKTDMAHLVAGPIEQIHRSLDRIEDEGRRYVERRRPGRADHTNADLITLMRWPAHESRTGGDTSRDENIPE